MKPYTPFQSFFSTIILLLLPFSTIAQTDEKIKDLFIEAESYFLFEEYKDALPLYQRVLALDPENFNIHYKIGICYLNDIYQKSKSIDYFEKAVKGTRPDSKTTSFKEKNAPPEALYYLGNAYRANNRLKEAIETYEQFKLVLDPLVYDVALVDEQISACKIASEQQRKPIYFISVNLGEGINDRFEEINPVISGDENIIAFTRKLQFYDAVFFSRRENGKWTVPENLTLAFGADGNSYTTGLSYDGKEMFIYRSDNFDGNLYVSNFKSGRWSKLEKLNGNINTKYWESHAALSKDGKTLYFTSNREGGYGGLDIYRSERTRSGDWGPGVNLGPVINSKYNEDTPFVTEDGNTIYFSSMGHYNMGGYDIFYSTRLDNGQWSKPVNVGFPLNTTNDDVFFMPIKDGAYAYYSRYNVDDSYGMTDLYKMEVFTELHPRKFIFNGITRVEGDGNPSFAQYSVALINTKTGKIIDQARLNADGSYSLNAQSGEFDLRITGSGINDHAEKISIPLDNPSNIITHSSILTILDNEATASETTPLPVEEISKGPELAVATLTYNVTTKQAIPIRLELERNTILKVSSLIDGKLLKNEQFDIRRRRFVYMLTPEPGINTIHFSLVNDKGDSTIQDVTVIYTPAQDELPPQPPTKVIVLSEGERYLGMSSLTEGTLADFLNSINFREMPYKSISDLYEYLIDNSEKQGYLIQDVDELIIRFLSQKDLNIFYEELQDHSSDSLVQSLRNTDMSSHSIFTSESLLDFLYQNSDRSNYNIDELRNTLYAIAALKRDPGEIIDLFESYATGELAISLLKMKQDAQGFLNTRAVADHILMLAKNNVFPLSQLDDMLKLAAYDVNVHFLTQSLIFISEGNLKQTLIDLNLEKQGIRNSSELISYLLENSEKRNYSKREILENIEKVRHDPYYFVDLFRNLLAERASGSLKEFLEEIDIRYLKINTYEQLVDYLLNQSKFRDYNREMIYQLLIDIINPKNVKEFISLLKTYADDRIIRAIDAADANQFSTPVEVIQYLLSVAAEYAFTERDILRMLLKMLLSKGPSGDGDSDKHKMFSNIDRPALVTAMVIVNAVIIVLLFLFFMRKKRKNE